MRLQRLLPRYHPCQLMIFYPFAGKRLGNVFTCKVQAFCVFLGGCFTISGNLSLNIYYLCFIRYKIDEVRIMKVVEPILLLLSVSSSVPLPLMFLIYGKGILTPYNSFCFWGPSDPADQTLAMFMYAGILLAVGCIFISMIMIISSTYRDEKRDNNHNSMRNNSLSTSGEENTCNNSAELSWNNPDFEGTRTRLCEALLYVGDFCLTWMPVFLTFFVFNLWSVQILKCIFQPLQGFSMF